MTYNVAQLFKAAFGINSPIYFPKTEEKNSPVLTYEGVEILPDYYDADSTSWMGTPILFSATFKNGTYKQYNSIGEVIEVSLDDFQLPSATLFSFRRAHNITRTNLLGSNGTVKEIFGFDDWTIDVRGVALDEPNKSASSQIDELLKWERLADSMKISGSLFNQRRIDRVVMQDWADNIQQAQPGVIPFSFQLFSDEAIELIL
jgi:hypothetical protein